jgi:hypothetical protein
VFVICLLIYCRDVFKSTDSRLREIQSACKFSFMSALRLGYGPFTPRDWLSLFDSGDSPIKAEGRMKLIAGFQSLLSLYLVFLWLLTAFGNPFDVGK